jgi:cephalosporin-C deacetylase-like acetyl esterase
MKPPYLFFVWIGLLCLWPQWAMLQPKLRIQTTETSTAWGQPLQIQLRLENINTAGTLTCLLKNRQGQQIAQQQFWPPKGQSHYTQKVDFQVYKADFYDVEAVWSSGGKDLLRQYYTVGYAVEKIFSLGQAPPDFDLFWQQTRQELTAIAPKYRILAQDSLSTPTYKMYLIEIPSLGEVTVRAWYRIPRNNWNAPVVLQLGGMGSALYPPKTLHDDPFRGIPDNYAVLALNIRAHGNSRDAITLEGGQIFTHQLHDKTQYFYRGAIADGLQALAFLRSKPELDQRNIIVEGMSQGGGLALILAALVPEVAFCMPDVPFMCDFDTYLSYPSWIQKAVANYADKQQVSLTLLADNLRYFDAKYFAYRIRAQVLMSVGMQDRTCPPATAFAAYNKIIAPKAYKIYPNGQHDGGGATHRAYKFEWLQQRLHR